MNPIFRRCDFWRRSNILPKSPFDFLYKNLLYESILILKSFRALFRKFANLSLKDAMSEALFYVAFCQMCHQMILLAKRL